MDVIFCLVVNFPIAVISSFLASAILNCHFRYIRQSRIVFHPPVPSSTVSNIKCRRNNFVYLGNCP